MTEEQITTPIGRDELLGAVADYYSEGYRLVQICCTAVGNAIEINYSFDREYRFRNLRLTIQPDEEIQSISLIYWNAFAYENEMHELFGVRIKNMIIDYKGNFYRIPVKAPYRPKDEAAEAETKTE
jgi:ech hydrogenase subunit D